MMATADTHRVRFHKAHAHGRYAIRVVCRCGWRQTVVCVDTNTIDSVRGRAKAYEEAHREAAVHRTWARERGEKVIWK